MRCNKLVWAIAILAIGAIGASPAVAAEWTGTGADDLWTNPNNWDTLLVPIDGEDARFNGGGSPIVDLAGTPVNLPSSYLFIRDVNPLIIQDTIDPLNPASLTVDIFHIQQYSRPRSQIRVPVTATTEIRSRYRLGGVEFYFQLDTPEMDLGRGDIYMFGDVNATTEFKVVKDDQTTNAYLRINPDTTVVPTLTTPTVLVDDSTSTFYAGGTVDTDTINITNGGRYFAEIDGALGDATTNVAVQSGGYLEIQAAQTALASITVDPFSVLAGDLTGATYGGGGNVTVSANTILAPSAGASPTRADLGGDAILYQGVLNGNKILTVGDNEVDAIYKGAAVGAFYGAGTMNGAELTAATDSGNLQVVFSGPGCPNVGDNKFFGDGTSTTADIQVINGAMIRLTGGMNLDYDYSTGAEPTRIDTFNIFGEVGNEGTQIMDHYRGNNGPHIIEGQTWNISHGTWNPGDRFASKGQEGTVNVTNARMRQPSTKFTAGVDTLTLALHETSVVEVGTGNHDFLEGLDGQAGNGSFTYEGTTVVQLNQRPNPAYAFDYSETTATPILADLLINSDIGVSGYDGTEIASDLQIGHEKYFIYRFTDGSASTRDYKGIKTATDAKIVPAGNAPEGVTNVLGIAPNDAWLGPNRIAVEVDASGAILRVGSADPNRIPSFHGGTLAPTPHAGSVEFEQPVTADKIETRSGTARFRLDLSVPSLDIGTDTTVQMDAGLTATVGDTLVANGNVTGGNGLLLSNDGTFEWAISANPVDGGGAQTGVAGTDWNLLLTDSLIDFDADDLDANTINFSLINAGLPEDQTVSTTDMFVVAANTSGIIDTPGTWNITGGSGWDVTGATLQYMEAYADVSGDTVADNCLVLSGVSFSYNDPTDFNTDGNSDLVDINLLTAEANLPIGLPVALSDPKFDLTGDDMINTADLDQWLVDAATINGFGSPYLKGDANLDGDVDVFAIDGSGDAQILSSNLGTASGAVWGDGDFNGDGDVDVFAIDGSGDAQLLSTNLGSSSDATAGTAEAIYNALTGELSFDVGEGIGVIGVEAEGLDHTAVDAGSNLGAPAQNGGGILAWFSATGLNAGMADVGAVLPTGMTAEEIGFSFTPLGGSSTVVPVTVVVPEPSTIAMLLVLGAMALCWRRRNA